METALILGASTIVATFLGPIFAVQVQKFLERRNSLKDHKMRIFSTLMATRASRLSPSHVEALNMIDLVFNGGSKRQRIKSETDVLDSWRDYLAHLTTDLNEHNYDRWMEKQTEMLVLLLSAMATDLDLRYDRVLLRNGAYIPRGHTDMESEQLQVRRLAIKVLGGEQPISMNVTGIAVDPQIVASQINLHKGLTEALTGAGSLRVKIDIPETVDRGLGPQLPLESQQP
ncbi:hypothetical protein AUC61_01310 [Pseudomonas sp. S25]|uniref:DUF6680 domain-containing protein n=1 Tax=Pseudomonas maioricensis TaxID=1766623 RepID=A0ABS9ZCL6_9PSED|nr:DUF6680 family protein [Pseudomonas sp. S25]MCI8208160.1 hypothetical protein [Pseudomonas sp. S25]